MNNFHDLKHLLLDSIQKIYRAIDLLTFSREQPAVRVCSDDEEELLLANPDGTVFRIRVDIVDISYYNNAVIKQAEEALA